MTSMTLEEALAGEFGESSRQTVRVVELPLAKIIPCPLHSFTLNETRVSDLKESITAHGLLNVLIVRDSENHPGYYELLAGYHREAACRSLGWEAVPCIIRNVDDSEAMDIIIYTNMQSGLEERKKTEVGLSFKLRNELQRRQGQRTDLQEDTVSEQSIEQLMQEQGWGATKIRRYIRFAYLVSPLGALLDTGIISDYAAEQLSFLSEEHQTECASIMQEKNKPLTIEQAKELKERENEEFTELLQSFYEKPQKKLQQRCWKLPQSEILPYLPDTLDLGNQDEVIAWILEALESYRKQAANFHLS